VVEPCGLSGIPMSGRNAARHAEFALRVPRGPRRQRSKKQDVCDELAHFGDCTRNVREVFAEEC
jgi:hypothetical protein